MLRDAKDTLAWDDTANMRAWGEVVVEISEEVLTGIAGGSLVLAEAVVAAAAAAAAAAIDFHIRSSRIMDFVQQVVVEVLLVADSIEDCMHLAALVAVGVADEQLQPNKRNNLVELVAEVGVQEVKEAEEQDKMAVV